MAENSKIEWTHHTFNVVWGCVEKRTPEGEMSDGCRYCYAREFSKRLGNDIWGATKERKVMSESYWKQPLKWNKQAEKLGERHRVFCSSMADVFEDNATVASQRERLWMLIEATPHLDWLLLTKRPENMVAFAPESWVDAWPMNVWAGCTTENQARFDERVPYLLQVPAVVRFLSAEPLTGPIDYMNLVGIDWVIVGGESGNNKGVRPMHPDWARGIRDACNSQNVAMLFKQYGEWIAWEPSGSEPLWKCQDGRIEDGNILMPDWDDPNVARRWNDGMAFAGTGVGHAIFERVGKHASGRTLDGVVWDEYPIARPSLMSL